MSPTAGRRMIWQYWETRGRKPAFVDGLHELVRRNSGCEVTLVTPETLHDFLPDLPPDVLRIGELAHKADMIRSMLVARYGGMWLDSDAIVLRDLNSLFALLEGHEFVCFNDEARLEEAKPWVRINCFLSRPNGTIIREWTEQQHAKFPRTTYEWGEIGSDILHPICLRHRERVKVLPFEWICPVPSGRVREFERKTTNADEIVDKSLMVMLSNAALGKIAPRLRTLTCQDIAEGDQLVSAVMRAALRGNTVDKRSASTFERVVGRLRRR